MYVGSVGALLVCVLRGRAVSVDGQLSNSDPAGRRIRTRLFSDVDVSRDVFLGSFVKNSVVEFLQSFLRVPQVFDHCGHFRSAFASLFLRGSQAASVQSVAIGWSSSFPVRVHSGARVCAWRSTLFLLVAKS